MDNKVEAVKDGQEQETNITETVVTSLVETGDDVDKQTKLTKDVPESEKKKLNCSNGTDESAQNGASVTSPLENLDVLNNGFLTAKSPCNVVSINVVNGTSANGNSDASSLNVDQNNELAADAQQPEKKPEETSEMRNELEETGIINETRNDSSQPSSTLTKKSSEEVTAIESSEHDEQIMTALLQEAVQDEVVLADDCGSSDLPSVQSKELPQSEESSETNLFKAAIDEFSESGGIPASLPDLKPDESAKLK